MSPPPAEPLLTDRAKRALRRAQEEQQRLGHPRLAAEHILLGLLEDRRGMSAFVLRELRVNERALADQARVELARAAPNPVVEEEVVVRSAGRWAQDFKQVSVGTEHLLLALITSGSAAGRWLNQAGAREAEARGTTERLFATVRRRSGEVELPQG